MKANSEKDFWIYIKVNNGVMESYCIDGMRMGKHTAAQYLIKTYNMSDTEAYSYLNTIEHLWSMTILKGINQWIHVAIVILIKKENA